MGVVQRDLVSKYIIERETILDEPLDMSDAQKDLVNRYIGDMQGMKAIGKEIHSDPRTFKKDLTSLGIVIPFPGSIWKKMQDHYSGRFDRPISKDLEEILYGSLLGDGNIRLQSKSDFHVDSPSMSEYKELLENANQIRENIANGGDLSAKDVHKWNEGINTIKNINTANFRMHKSITEIKWVKNLDSLFKKEINTGDGFIKKVNRVQDIKWSCGFDTNSSVQLFNIWKDWYTKDDKFVDKYIPRDKLTHLTPDIVLQWYTGDGYYTGNAISFATHNFTKSDNEYLVGLLKERGIDSKIYPDGDKFRIGVSHRKINREIFFDYLSQAKSYNLASEQFPHKFNFGVMKRDLITELKISNPEFFDRNSGLKYTDY